jgi:hypothetical protein
MWIDANVRLLSCLVHFYTIREGKMKYPLGKRTVHTCLFATCRLEQFEVYELYQFTKTICQIEWTPFFTDRSWTLRLLPIGR